MKKTKLKKRMRRITEDEVKRAADLYAEGYSYPSIAEELGYSASTIFTHVRLYRATH